MVECQTILELGEPARKILCPENAAEQGLYFLQHVSLLMILLVDLIHANKGTSAQADRAIVPGGSIAFGPQCRHESGLFKNSMRAIAGK